MNMMTPDLSPRARWTTAFPVPPTIPVLLAQVDRACFVARITSTRFGAQLGDGGMIHRIRAGSFVRIEKRFRILAHAEKLIEASRASAFTLLIEQFDGGGIGALVEDLIGRLDARDGDLDLEDSETGTHEVDERGRYMRGDGLPGDNLDAEPDDDAKGDPAWAEWHTRGRHKLTGHGAEIAPRHAGEDDEDDDAREQDDEPEEDLVLELNGDERDIAWVEALTQPTEMITGVGWFEPSAAGDPEDAEELLQPAMMSPDIVPVREVRPVPRLALVA